MSLTRRNTQLVIAHACTDTYIPPSPSREHWTSIALTGTQVQSQFTCHITVSLSGSAKVNAGCGFYCSSIFWDTIPCPLVSGVVEHASYLHVEKCKIFFLILVFTHYVFSLDLKVVNVNLSKYPIDCGFLINNHLHPFHIQLC